MIAGEIGIIPVQETNAIIKLFVGTPEVANHRIDLNISTKALTIIYADPKNKERLNRLIARHNIELVSFAAQGSEVRGTLLFLVFIVSFVWNTFVCVELV
ncbi:hypothetical protein ANCCAN_30607 [Ancylostoma caninum]|uniref:Uncharacterized protein n=1 Tax=Ancylostoma caninum TaxID=29170 RepID=A0A368EVW1_ANCCA|nr:hypothetical protein ANCCAN_30607 [Ancylostoma caninum]